MSDKDYRDFAVHVSEMLTWVFNPDGSQRGTGKVARQVLEAIRNDLRDLRVNVQNEDIEDV